MKKRIVAIMLSICCAAMVFTGCGSSSGKVTLKQSDYKGIEVAKVTVDEVTEEDVEEAIKSTLEDNAETKEITDRAVKNGDMVNMNYVGTLNDKVFDNRENIDLEIGSDSFVPGFEEQLIGHEKGEEFHIKVTFPEEYPMNEELEGKETDFAIKINSITKIKVPKLDDDFVQSVSDSSKTVEEYKKEVRKQLEEENKEDAKTTFADNVMEAVLKNAEVSEYDEDKLEELKEDSKNYYEQIVAMYYGMEMSDYLEEAGQSEEDFDKEIEESAKETLKMQMVCEYIAEKENLEISDKEFDEKIQQMVEENGYDSADDMLRDYAAYYSEDNAADEEVKEEDGEDAEDDSDSAGEAEDDAAEGEADASEDETEVSDEAIQKAKDELRLSFLQEKVSNWLVENAKQVEAPEEDDTEDAVDDADAADDSEESGEGDDTAAENSEE